MFKNIENLKIIRITKGTSKNRASVVCRKNHAFVLRTAGVSRHTFSAHCIDTHPGEILFLPQGASYEMATLSNTPCMYVSIIFEAEITNAVPAVYALDGFQEADTYEGILADLWKFGGTAEQYKCYSIFYALLAYIENLESLTYADKKNFSVISPAVSYLKKHIFDADLKIETLHRLCGISGTYFRKLFQAHYAMSPQNYILGKRLSHAKTIMDSGEFDTITEIATSVGYNDSLYFSRAFKKKYGVSPTQYARN